MVGSITTLSQCTSRGEADDGAPLTIMEGISRKIEAISREKKYIKCDFILGSTAEIERIWSIARALMAENQMAMNPLLLESLMFLKVNHT